MTISIPPKLLTAYMQNIQTIGTYSDGLFSEKANIWQIDLYLSSPQLTSYPLSNTPYQYNALDINVGDWIANNTGGKANRITSIVGSTSMFASILVDDPYSYNALLDPTQQGNGIIQHGNVFVFSLNQETQLPILTPEQSNMFDPIFGIDMISRFYYTSTLSGSTSINYTYNVSALIQSFIVDSSSKDINQGDVVQLLSNGNVISFNPITNQSYISSEAYNLELLINSNLALLFYSDGITYTNNLVIYSITDSSIIASNPIILETINNTQYNILKINDSKFIYFYLENTNSYPAAMYFSISGSTIDIINTCILNNESSNTDFKSFLINDSNSVFFYTNNNNNLVSVNISTTDSTINVSSLTTLNTVNGISNLNILNISSSDFILEFSDRRNGSYLSIIYCSIIGTTLSISDSYVLDTSMPSPFSPIKIMPISSSNAIIFYIDYSTNYLKNVYFSFSTSSITSESPTTLSYSSSYDITSITVNNDFIIVFGDYDTGILEAIYCSLNGSEISINNPITLNSSCSAYNISLISISSTEYDVIYTDYNAGENPFAITLTLNGSSITYGSPIQINNDLSSSLLAQKIDNSSFIISYVTNSALASYIIPFPIPAFTPNTHSAILGIAENSASAGESLYVVISGTASGLMSLSTSLGYDLSRSQNLTIFTGAYGNQYIGRAIFNTSLIVIYDNFYGVIYNND